MATGQPAPIEFGRYRCLEAIGGGMADVYRGYDPLMDRQVAIKVLRPAECRDEKVRLRFLREAQLACRCHHDNIVITYDAGEQDGRPYTVMELLPPDSSLTGALARGELSRERILEVALEIARALAYVHSLGIVHRDVKPDNVCIDGRTGRAKLIDFGIARTADWGISTQGTVGGTLFYMAPELIQGQTEPSPLNDIYSFGAMLFEMLSGRRVVKGATMGEMCISIVKDQPDLEPLRSRGVASQVVDLVAACLQKDPARRPQSFVEIGERISAILAASRQTTLLQAAKKGEETKAPPKAPPETPRWPVPKWVLAAAAGCVLGIVIAVMAWPRPAPAELHLPAGDMVLVKAGPALLGPDRHQVAVKAFYIDKYEVSNAAYEDFCRATGRLAPEGENSADLPVVSVSFPDAEAFARWAGKRLPRADEWEKAARGTTGIKFPWGDAPEPSRMNCCGTQAGRTPVKSYPQGASPYGAVNLLGNVWEWVDEREHPDPDTMKLLAGLDWARKLRPPLSPEETYVQIRGGSYLGGRLDDAERLVWGSALLPARVRRPDVGFRCAKDAPK